MAWLSVVGVDAGVLQHAAGVAGALHGQRQQQPLDRDELVAGLVGDLLGGVEDARQLGRQIDLAGAAAGNLRALGQHPLDGRAAHRPGGRRRAGSARRPCLPGRRAAPSGDDRCRTAGGPRARRGSGPPARSPWRGRYTSRSPCCPSSARGPPHRARQPPSFDRIQSEARRGPAMRHPRYEPSRRRYRVALRGQKRHDPDQCRVAEFTASRA